MCGQFIWRFHCIVSTGILDFSLLYAMHNEVVLRNVPFIFLSKLNPKHITQQKNSHFYWSALFLKEKSGFFPLAFSLWVWSWCRVLLKTYLCGSPTAGEALIAMLFPEYCIHRIVLTHLQLLAYLGDYSGSACFLMTSCLRSDWIGFWATRCSGNCPYPWQGSWN